MTPIGSGTRPKKAPRRAPELLSFLLRWLGDGDGLARVTHLEARKAPHSDVLAELADLRRDQLPYRDGLVLDKRLLEQADFLIELLHLARDHLLGDMSRLAAGDRLRKIDFLLTGKVGFRHVFLADVFRIAGCDMHRDIMQQFLEVISACHEVALAVHFDEHTNLAAGVNVVRYRSFAGHASGFFLRNR